MRIATNIVAALVLFVAGCAAATEQSSTAPEATVTPVALPAPSQVPTPPTHVPDVSQTQDFPATCVAARFTLDGADHVSDSTTGLTWIDTDIAFSEDVAQTSTPDLACGVGGSGFRAATSAEVIALGTAIPGCSLPGLFHGVYSWATFAGPLPVLPIKTSDGCVDVKTGTSYAGDCHVWTTAPVSRSTLCVK